MSGGYNPSVMNPRFVGTKVNTLSGGYQTPFFFGGSQIPDDLHLSKIQYNGSSGSGLNRKVHPNTPSDFETILNKKCIGNGFHMGSMSKTHPGDMDFTTKKGDKVFHRKGHNIKMPHSLPFMNKS